MAAVQFADGYLQGLFELVHAGLSHMAFPASHKKDPDGGGFRDGSDMVEYLAIEGRGEFIEAPAGWNIIVQHGGRSRNGQRRSP